MALRWRRFWFRLSVIPFVLMVLWLDDAVRDERWGWLAVALVLLVAVLALMAWRVRRSLRDDRSGG